MTNDHQPAFFSATNALYFMTSNLSLGATFTHVFFWHWQDIKPFLKTFNPRNKEEFVVHDPHWERMKVYKQIPRWWYFVLLLGAYAIAQATNYEGHSGLPWWALTVILLISLTLSLLFATLAMLALIEGEVTMMWLWLGIAMAVDHLPLPAGDLLHGAVQEILLLRGEVIVKGNFSVHGNLVLSGRNMATLWVFSGFVTKSLWLG